jgi:DNA helicase-2/ATP-dependent DNA helicase PcrA
MQPTPEQQDILGSDERTLIVSANAGAAKTTTLAFRIQEGLQRGINPSRILSLTFTEPARQALRSALIKVGVPASVCNTLWIQTFDDLSAHVLRKLEGERPDELVPSLAEPEALAPHVWEAVESVRAMQERAWDDDLLLPAETHADSGFVERFLRQRSRIAGQLALDRALWDGARLDGDLAISLNADYTLLRVQRHYDQLRQPTGADRPLFRGPHDATYDLARLLADPDSSIQPEDLAGWPARTEAVMVDEMHDMNRAMFTVLQALLRPSRVFFCGVGDVDQVIHEADGAQRYFMEQALSLETARTVVSLPLTLTHRFGPKVSSLAGRFAAKAYRSVADSQSDVTCLHHGGPKDAPCEAQVASLAARWRKDGGKMSEFAVVLRHAAQSVLVENALLDADIPYVTTGFDGYLLRPEVLLVRGLMAIANGRFDAIDDPATRRRVVQEMVFFCRVTLDHDVDEGESAASRLNEAVRHVSHEPSNLRPFFEHQVLKNAPSEVAARLKAAVRILQDDASPSAFARFLDALEIAKWARETWVERQRQEDAQTHIEGLKQAAQSFKTPQDFFASLNESELKQRTLKRRSGAFITLASIASVKGLEFGHVVMPFVDEGSFPARLEDQASDERALFYVAMTRARERLTFITHRDRPSPFLRELRLA